MAQVLISISTGQDILGQTGTGRPVVPLSRDKKILVPVSLCPGKRAGAYVPGMYFINFKKEGQISCFIASFFLF
jgi:hypothetical protein